MNTTGNVLLFLGHEVVLDLRDGLHRARQGRAGRQCVLELRPALIFHGQEARRQDSEHDDEHADQQHVGRHDALRVIEHHPDAISIPIRQSLEPGKEPIAVLRASLW